MIIIVQHSGLYCVRLYAFTLCIVHGMYVWFILFYFITDLVVMRTLNALVQQYPVIIHVYAHLVFMGLAL